jgi:outer membrane biosynthesis protein TonB
VALGERIDEMGARANALLRMRRARRRLRPWGAPGALRALGVLVALAAGPASAAPARAASFTWTGAYPGTTESAAHWSLGENWEGGTAPSAAQPIETLTFPHLSSSACTSLSETDACYGAVNDIGGLAVESLRLDDGDGYLLGGNEAVTLGSGGLTAAPAPGTTGFGGAFVTLPFRLGANQTWSVANRGGGAIGENGILLFSELTGPGAALTFELSAGPALILANSTEVGPVTVEGPNAAGEHIENGLAILGEGELDSTNGLPVVLRNIYFTGTGAVGALSTRNSTLIVGNESIPAEGIEAAAVQLDPETATGFEVLGSGATARTDYSQLTASGPVELAGPLLVIVSKPQGKGAICPTLTPGEKLTLVSTTGGLSGAFSDAPEGGPELPISFAKACSHSSQTMRISYNRTGGTETVTGTVEAAAKERQETEANEQREREVREREAKEKEIKERETKQEESARKIAEEQAHKAAEEVAALAVKKHQEEEAAAKQQQQGTTAPVPQDNVLGSIESKPKPLTRAQLLARALRHCRTQPKRTRARCDATAYRRYGSKAHKRGKGSRKA